MAFQVSHLNDECGASQSRANGNHPHSIEPVLVCDVTRRHHGQAIHQEVGISLDQPVLHSMGLACFRTGPSL